EQAQQGSGSSHECDVHLPHHQYGRGAVDSGYDGQPDGLGRIAESDRDHRHHSCRDGHIPCCRFGGGKAFGKTSHLRRRRGSVKGGRLMIQYVINLVSVWAIPVFLLAIPLHGAVRGVKVYESFVEGAKEGFQVGVSIMTCFVGSMVEYGALCVVVC